MDWVDWILARADWILAGFIGVVAVASLFLWAMLRRADREDRNRRGPRS